MKKALVYIFVGVVLGCGTKNSTKRSDKDSINLDNKDTIPKVDYLYNAELIDDSFLKNSSSIEDINKLASIAYEKYFGIENYQSLLKISNRKKHFFSIDFFSLQGEKNGKDSLNYIVSYLDSVSNCPSVITYDFSNNYLINFVNVQLKSDKYRLYFILLKDNAKNKLIANEGFIFGDISKKRLIYVGFGKYGNGKFRRLDNISCISIIDNKTLNPFYDFLFQMSELRYINKFNANKSYSTFKQFTNSDINFLNLKEDVNLSNFYNATNKSSMDKLFYPLKKFNDKQLPLIMSEGYYFFKKDSLNNNENVTTW